MENESINFSKLNIDIASKVAWAGFLYQIEIIFIGNKLKKVLFLETKVSRSNGSFSEKNQYSVVFLK